MNNLDGVAIGTGVEVDRLSLNSENKAVTHKQNKQNL